VKLIGHRDKRAWRAGRKSPRILFVGSGGFVGWAGQGAELCQSEVVVRTSFDDSALLAERYGFPASEIRDASAALGPSRLPSQLRSLFLQVALVDLWRSLGVVPDATMGLSMGEVVSLYAAGAISREDLVATICELSVAATQHETWRWVQWHVAASTAEARRLCQNAPAPLYHVGTFGPDFSIVTCVEDDEPVVADFLASEAMIKLHYGSAGAVHLPQAWRSRALESALARVSLQPGACPMYSAATGGRLPPDADLGAPYWQMVFNQPFYLDAALLVALGDGYDVVVNLGAAITATTVEMKKTIQRAGTHATLVDTMRPRGSELDTWAQAVEIMRELGALTLS
jgi:acyl transferase domain-containing protein